MEGGGFTSVESLYPTETTTLHVPDDFFNLFHSIDRELYTRLVQNLGLDPDGSVYIFAFWLWMERCGGIKIHLIKNMLSLSPKCLNDLAVETALTLICIFENVDRQFDIVLLPMLMGIPPIELKHFLQNRDVVIQGLEKVIDTVCVRAFCDIYHWARSQNADAVIQENTVLEEEETPAEVSPDERTIFLTFSKGYPITQDEIRDFFTRRFGDFIEDLIMQEVEEGEQVLYARIVAKSAEVIDEILRGRKKTKFSVNGKHVRARKYVKQLHQLQRKSFGHPSTTSIGATNSD